MKSLKHIQICLQFFQKLQCLRILDDVNRLFQSTEMCGEGNGNLPFQVWQEIQYFSPHSATTVYQWDS